MSENSIEFSLSNSEQRDSWLNSGHQTLDADRKLHSLPESIILDRGPQFVAGLMRELNEMLGIKSKLLTVFHPQTDRQTERVNQELEQYLRMFINHRQEQ